MIQINPIAVIAASNGLDNLGFKNVSDDFKASGELTLFIYEKNLFCNKMSWVPYTSVDSELMDKHTHSMEVNGQLFYFEFTKSDMPGIEYSFTAYLEGKTNLKFTIL